MSNVAVKELTGSINPEQSRGPERGSSGRRLEKATGFFNRHVRRRGEIDAASARDRSASRREENHIRDQLRIIGAQQRTEQRVAKTTVLQNPDTNTYTNEVNARMMDYSWEVNKQWTNDVLAQQTGRAAIEERVSRFADGIAYGVDYLEDTVKDLIMRYLLKKATKDDYELDRDERKHDYQKERLTRAYYLNNRK